MNEFHETLKKLIELMGFDEPTILSDEQDLRVTIFLPEAEFLKRNLPHLVVHIDHIGKLMAKKQGSSLYHIDVNNYRKEREKLIVDIARGAAKKAATTKEDIVLPAMNAYERRLIHAELATRPDVKTESVGEGRERYVVVKPIL